MWDTIKHSIFLSVRLQVEVITKKIKNVQWEFSRWRNWLKRRFIWWWRRVNHLPHYITRNILDFFRDALIHEVFISQKQEWDLHRFVKTKYTTEYKIYHRVKFIRLSIQLDIVKDQKQISGSGVLGGSMHLCPIRHCPSGLGGLLCTISGHQGQPNTGPRYKQW